MKQFDDAMLFKTIIDQGSLASAGELLGINASAVSKRLARLEQQLGTPLIRRTTRRMALTESGQYFYQQLTHLQAHWQATWDETASLGSEPRGCLRIATPQPVASRFLMPLLMGFQRTYPAIRLQLLHEQYNQLPASYADISICRELSGFESSTIVASYLCSYQNQLFASPNYLEQYSEPLSLDKLRQHRGLYYSQGEAIKPWQFEQGEARPEVALTTNNTEVLISAARTGMGVVYIPSLLIQRELAAGELVPLLKQYHSQHHHTFAYFTKTQTLPQKIRLLIDYIKNNVAISDLV